MEPIFGTTSTTGTASPAGTAIKEIKTLQHH
jgi:hypothetical protein